MIDNENKDLEEKLKQFQCNHCGNCSKGLSCQQDDKLFEYWKKYYESKVQQDEYLNNKRTKSEFLRY